MGWQKSFINNIGDVLRFIGYSFLAIDLIVLACLSLAITSKLAWYFFNWLNRIVFAHYW